MPDLKQPPPASPSKAEVSSSRLVLELEGVLELSDDDLLRLSSKNDHLQFEQDAHGNLVIMAPAGGTTSNRNIRLTTKVSNWNDDASLGVVFGPDGGFKLPNGATRAPDVSWIPSERWEALSDEEREKFPPLCPDFACELRSASDSLAPLRDKMDEYMNNGCRLGWLIDPFEEQAFVYEPDAELRHVDSFEATLSGGDVLPGFKLALDALR